jgi:hypothetical protein
MRKTARPYYKRGGKRVKARKTMKHEHKQSVKKSHIIRTFLDMLNVVKIYHWKTRSYAQHKATDELYGRLNENIDKFIEILLGKDESRFKLFHETCRPIDTANKHDFKERIYKYRSFLMDLSAHFDPHMDSDLLSLRDEIVGDVNQFLYLMTFDK